MSHQVTTSLVSTLGRNHDGEVFKWRETLLEELSTQEVTGHLAGIISCYFTNLQSQLNPPPHGNLMNDGIESSDESLSHQSHTSVCSPSFSPITSMASLISQESDLTHNEFICAYTCKISVQAY